jgi:hypothetical protein
MKPSTRTLKLKGETVKLLSPDELAHVAGGESNSCDPKASNRPSFCCNPP